ncbi:MAG: hypothetical protein ACYC06_01585 [Ilumatobacteraceae bacterium]
MTTTPPFSWSEIATRADLAQFATRNEMRTEFANFRLEMAKKTTIELLAKMRRVQRITFCLIAALNIFTAVIFTVALHYFR